MNNSTYTILFGNLNFRIDSNYTNIVKKIEKYKEALQNNDVFIYLKIKRKIRLNKSLINYFNKINLTNSDINVLLYIISKRPKSLSYQHTSLVNISSYKFI